MVGRDHHGLGGAEANALQPLDGIQPIQKIVQIVPSVLPSVAVQMNSRKNHLTVALPHQPLHLGNGVVDGLTADGTASVRDNAIRAEITASVLDLHRGTDPLVRLQDHGLKGSVGKNGRYRIYGRTLGKNPIHQCGKARLIPISENDIRLGTGFGLHLRQASQNGNDRIGRDATGAPHHLTALAGALLGNGTGMDHRKIAGRSEGRKFVPPLLEQATEDLRFIMIHFTTQGTDRNPHGTHLPFYGLYTIIYYYTIFLPF